MSVEKAAGKSRARDIVIVVVLLGVGVGGIAGFGFYHDEVTSYIRLQGWSLGATGEGTKQFLDAMAAKDGERIEGMFASRENDTKVVREGGKVVRLTVTRFGSSTPLRLEEIVPSADGKVGTPRLITLDGGLVVVPVDFPGTDLSLEVRWDRIRGAWKVTGVVRIKPGE